MDRMMAYQMIYALAALDEREAALFGNSAPRACEAFAHSVAGDYFPELWFELPLKGEAWFDLHALVEPGDLSGRTTFEPDTCGWAPEAFGWFAQQGPRVRQLALSWDLNSENPGKPAVQLLKRGDDEQITCDFLAAAGKPDAVAGYRTFAQRLPKDWFPCYTGLFPQRDTPFLRVECIPTKQQQRSYANNPNLLAEHMRQTGFTHFGDTLLPRCQTLAASPFQLEFQFDVSKEGAAESTFSASIRFAAPIDNDRRSFAVNGDAGMLMAQTEAWGLADERWRLLEGTTFSKRIKHDGEGCLLYCFPSFLKLRWRDGAPLDAKAYLIAGVQGYKSDAV